MLGNLVHPCREDICSNTVFTVMDVQTYILILYNYKWILEICGSEIAFLQGAREGSLGVGSTTCLLNIKLLFFTLLHAARCSELLEDASL